MLGQGTGKWIHFPTLIYLARVRPIGSVTGAKSPHEDLEVQLHVGLTKEGVFAVYRLVVGLF